MEVYGREGGQGCSTRESAVKRGNGAQLTLQEKAKPARQKDVY